MTLRQMLGNSAFRNEVMQTKEETQPVLPLPAMFPVFAESDFAQRRPGFNELLSWVCLAI